MQLTTSERTLYESKKPRIRITRHLLDVKGTHYPIRNITKVKLSKQNADTRPAATYIFLSLLMILAAFILRQSLLGLVGLLVLLFSIFDPTNTEPSYKLFVTTSQGEEIVLEPKSTKDMKDMQRALDDAMAMVDEH